MEVGLVLDVFAAGKTIDRTRLELKRQVGVLVRINCHTDGGTRTCELACSNIGES